MGFPDLSAALGVEKTTAEVQEQLAAMRAQQPFLILRDGERRQRVVPLSGERFVVGRAGDADLCLAWDPTVSAMHASLYDRGGGRWAIDDDGLSRNGTFVNGERVIGRRLLHNGDVIRLGGMLVGFVDPRPPVVATVAIDDHPKVTVSAAQRRVLVALCRPMHGPAATARPASNQEIADELHVSIETVKTHLGNLYDQFGLAALRPNEKRAQLAWQALQSAVIDDAELRR
jgi:pSer/pThr/pTyr-binding forkhead associated (FHA) protein